MTQLPRRYWSHMTSKHFSQLDHERVIAVLPVGAIEQHGPHLPVSVDSCIIDGIIERAIPLLPDDLPVTVLPTLAIGKSNEHDQYPGTLTYSSETLIHMWMEVGASVAAAGIRKLVLFYSHGGQISVMDIVGRDLRIKHNMIVVSSNWFALGLPAGMFGADELKHGIHGGELETSMMLALAPEQVDMSEAQHFHSLTEQLAHDYRLLSLAPGGKLSWQIQDLNPLGACGDASNASAEKGEQVLDFVARRFIELLQEIDRLPLSILAQRPAW
jgi:creatinine amidohydrolase